VLSTQLNNAARLQPGALARGDQGTNRSGLRFWTGIATNVRMASDAPWRVVDGVVVVALRFVNLAWPVSTANRLNHRGIDVIVWHCFLLVNGLISGLAF
jgi:hypothetical protein